MAEKEILARLARATLEGNEVLAKQAAEEVLATDMDITKAIRNGLAAGMTEIGQKYSKFEVFLPELMLAGEAMNTALAILLPTMMARQEAEAFKGRIVIGTVSGDVHDIGKNLVSTFLTVAGYQVSDLGTSVLSRDFTKKAQEVDADIIALSCLISPSMYYQKDVIERLKGMGIRKKHHVVVGGGPITPEWAEEIGADGYGKYAEDAVRLCDTLMEADKAPGEARPIVIGL